MVHTRCTMCARGTGHHHRLGVQWEEYDDRWWNRRHVTRRIEWPTVVLIVVVHASWVGAMWLDGRAPLGVGVVAMAAAIAWHSSLQHELLHGHPFAHRRLNDAFGAAPILLRLPYSVYRTEHLAHHANDELTDPTTDCESFYVTAAKWESSSPFRRGVLVWHHTLLGRLLLGPAMVISGFLSSQARRVAAGDRALARIWVRHLLAVAAVLWIVSAGFGVALWRYAVAVYLAHSLLLVRSYLEHRWVGAELTRCATVRCGRVMSLLFLNNNLHDTHHCRPGAAWFQLPRLAESLGSDERSSRGAGWYAGYFEVLKEHLVRPFDHPVHPNERALLGAARSSPQMGSAGPTGSAVPTGIVLPPGVATAE